MTWEEEWDNIPDTTPEASETLEQQEMATEAWSSLIALLPPREPACVILKDLLDHSLNEIAASPDSPLTAVKAALHRGRQKLRAQADSQVTPPAQE
jgi:RNA polymerase sigma-70 factor (ECF subfamily)